MPTITNFTIAANFLRGVSDFEPTVTNSIIYYNSADSDDDVTNPCIDAGDPASNWPLESEPNGG